MRAHLDIRINRIMLHAMHALSLGLGLELLLLTAGGQLRA